MLLVILLPKAPEILSLFYFFGSGVAKLDEGVPLKDVFQDFRNSRDPGLLQPKDDSTKAFIKKLGKRW